MDRIVIGVVGPMASGKGVLVKRFAELGYKPHSLSDQLREAVTRLGLPHDRNILQDLGDFLRRYAGNAALAERAAAAILTAGEKLHVIESIRHPDEVRALRQIFAARIIAVDATLEQRFRFMNLRGREGDPKTWEEFKVSADRDLGIGQEFHGQQVAECLRMADYTIRNNGSLDEFRHSIDNLFAELGIEGQRSTVERR